MIFQKKTLIIIIFLSFGSMIRAIELNADLFSYDENRVAEEFKELDYLENLLIENPGTALSEIVEQNPNYKYFLYTENYSPLGITEISAPGRIPSFWWSFTISFVGSLTLYGAVAGPIAVGVVYFNTGKNKNETKKAIYGCLTGTVLGLGIRYIASL